MATPTTWWSATRSGWAPARRSGHYVDLTDFFNKNKLSEVMAPATVKYYAEYPGGSGKYWAIPLEGDAIGWAYRKDWFEDPKEMAAFKAKYGYDLAVPKTYAQLRDIAEFFHRPDQKRYGVAIYTDNSYDALAMGVESAIFSHGGELGDYASYKVDGIINSKEAVAALEMYKELYKFTPPGWGKTFFVEDNQAITEGLAAMSMNFFAFFPALANKASNPHADQTGFFANPAGPDRQALCRAGRPGHLGHLLLEEAGRVDEVPGVVHQGRDAEEVGRAWRLHLQPGGSEVGRIPARLRPTTRRSTSTMFMVKDFWATPEYAELLDQMNQNIYPYVVGGKGTAQEALDGHGKVLDRNLQEVQALQLGCTARGAGGSPGQSCPICLEPAPNGRQYNASVRARDGRAPAGRDAQHERSRHPQSLHHPDDHLPDHLQCLSADLFAWLFLHRLARLATRRPSSSVCRTIATC